MKASTKGRILLVEDDPAILLGVEDELRREGYEVACAADGEEARRRLADEPYDLVVLDWMLPKLDGLVVLRWLRRRSATVPVLILSAKSLEKEKVEGLRAGADDYLAKPFGLEELLARIQALLRRAHGPVKRLTFGAVTVDLERRRVLRDGRQVALSRKELEVLLLLARNHDRTVTREEILDSVWGYFASSAGRAVDYHVLNLRRKLDADPSTPRHIVTRHGQGYQLVI